MPTMPPPAIASPCSRASLAPIPQPVTAAPTMSITATNSISVKPFREDKARLISQQVFMSVNPNRHTVGMLGAEAKGSQDDLALQSLRLVSYSVTLPKLLHLRWPTAVVSAAEGTETGTGTETVPSPKFATFGGLRQGRKSFRPPTRVPLFSRCSRFPNDGHPGAVYPTAETPHRWL